MIASRDLEQRDVEVKKTVLYDRHKAADAKMAPFAGYIMPLWYTSISEEHKAVRTAGGIFDCTHMGIFEISGNHAADFLELIFTNKIADLAAGHARYGYVLNKSGDVLDDVIVYAKVSGHFILVANAANKQKIAEWLTAQRGKNKKFESVDISGPDKLVDIALQGPSSTNCLGNLTKDDIKTLAPFTFLETDVVSIHSIITRTGYTGAKVGYEIIAAAEKAGKIWDNLVESGAKPCGLGARDSLRIEAGLPLYGHELAGDLDITPCQAGYGWAVKMDKEFIGKTTIAEKCKNYTMRVERCEFPGEKGIRPLRQGDGIISTDGICIGTILSCAAAGNKQIVLAFVRKNSAGEGDKIAGYYTARNQMQIDKGKKEKVAIGEKLTGEIEGKVVSRFEKF